MDSWELIATLGATLAAWGTMLWLMWRMQNSVRKDLGGAIGSPGEEIAGLRGDMRDEIAGLRSEIAGLRGEMRGEIAGLRSEISGLRSETRTEITELRNTLTERIAINERTLVRLSGELAEFRGEMRGDLKGVNTALLVLREDFRAHVHGVRAG